MNLPWVREHYFSEVARQVARISGTDDRLTLAILDAAGQRVVGPAADRRSGGVLTEQFPMTFFDPAAVDIDPPPDLRREQWLVEVNYAADAALVRAMQGANRTLLVATIAALSLGIGLMLTVRATRANAAAGRDAIGVRVNGDARTEDADRDHSRGGRHDPVPGRITSAEGPA